MKAPIGDIVMDLQRATMLKMNVFKGGFQGFHRCFFSIYFA